MRFFFYGTLLDSDVRKAVLGDAALRLHGRPAVLAGYRRVFAPGRTYPMLVRDAAAAVPGETFDGISPAMCRTLARYEGAEYAPSGMPVRLATGATVRAWVFMPLVPSETGQEEWTLATWRQRFKRRFLAGLRGAEDAGEADGSRLRARRPR